MKKYLSIILINVMAIALSGCGSSGDESCCSQASIQSKNNFVSTDKESKKNSSTAIADNANYASINPSLGINSINHIPFGTFDHFTTGVNVAYSGQLTAKDDDHDTLTFQVQNKPSHGTLTSDKSGAFTYVPDIGYEGADSFSYTASDDVSTSLNKNVTISVEGVNKDVPYAPSDLKLEVESDCSLDVEWTDNSDNEDRFNIYVDDDFIKSVDGSDEGASTIETTLCGLDQGKEYKVSVEAVNEAGPSEAISGKVTLGSSPDKLNFPEDFRIVNKKCDSIRFKWDRVDGADGYEIYQDGKRIKKISYYPEGGIVIKDLTANKSYTFELRAINDKTKSDPTILQVTLDSE